MPPINKPTLRQSWLGNTHLYHCLKYGEIHVVFGRFETTFEFSPYVKGIIPRNLKEGDPYRVHSAIVRNNGSRITPSIRFDTPTTGPDSKGFGVSVKAGKDEQLYLGQALKEFSQLIGEIVPPSRQAQARRTCAAVIAARALDRGFLR